MTSGRNLLFLLTIIASVGADGLGVWQLRRLWARRTWNAAAMAERARPEVDLLTTGLDGRANYRRVHLAGRYDLEREIVLRDRLLRGTPGIHVITPLRIGGRDTAVLVHRGFVPTADAGMPPSRIPFGEADSVDFIGFAMTVPDQGDGWRLETAAGPTWRRLDLSALRRQLPYPIAPYYVIVAADSVRTREHTLKGHALPIRIEPPPLDNGPHLSYAVQWFLIGGAALGFGLFFVRRQPGGSVVPG